MLYSIFNNLWNLWWSLYLVQVLKAPATIVGLIATIQSTSRILFQLPGGIISDRVGRKRVIVIGTAMRVIAPIFMVTARSWEWVIPGVVLNSLASIYMPAFNAIIAESLPKENRGTAFGAYRMMTSLPSVFMPVVSGYYLDIMGLEQGVRIGLIMFIGAAIVATVVRAIFLVETLDRGQSTESSERESIGGIFNSFRKQNRTVYAMLLVAIFSSFGVRLASSFLSVYAVEEIELTKTEYGLLQSIATGISTPLFLISGILADRFGRVGPILLARALGPIDSLNLLFLRNFDQLMMAYGVIGVAGGLGGGRIRGGGYMGGPAWNALISDLVPSRDRGKVMGLMGTISGIISLPASYIGGVLYESNPFMALFAGAAVEALAIPVIIFFVKEPKESEIVS
jgi:MFS family permease